MSTRTVFLLVAITLATYSCDAASCIPKFKNFAMFQGVGQTCQKALTAKGVDLKTLPMTPEDLEKNKWDDKCMANCTLGEMKFIANHTFQKDTLLAMLKENAPKEAQAKLAAIANECAELAFKKHDHHKNDKDNKDKKSAKPAMANKPKVSPKFAGKPTFDKEQMRKFLCIPAARFTHCFSQKEQQVC